MAYRGRITHARLMCGAAMLALLSSGSAAVAQENAKFNIAPQPLASALNEFAVQSPWPILYTSQMTGGKTTAGVNGETDPELALNTLLQGTGLGYRREGNTFLIVSASDPQSGSAAGDGADAGTVQALIVTAQKREENIQDVPIAMSAFTQEDLTKSQVTGGPDLMTQVPNMTFTKTNFSGYSIQIRGIGTQAISATTDAAVAVAENNTPFIRNRFFEQEFYDLERVEVLRGPQGTLYGRNATAGVVNIITAKPSFHFASRLSLDVGNYNSTRLEGMINLPLVDDVVALRLAGAWTKRDGYDVNQITGNRIDGRDLWSTRLTLRFTPTERLNANLIWEHFNENDDRLRSGKQLCHTDRPTEIAGFTTGNSGVSVYDNAGLPNSGQGSLGGWTGAQAVFSQGCAPTSLYAPESFQTPNGWSLPYYLPLGAVGLPYALDNPYVSRTQSPDLRVIESTVDPQYRAKTDLAELQVSIDLPHSLTLASETGYLSDFIFSKEDYNRFNTAPGAWLQPDAYAPGWIRDGVLSAGPNGGVFCDPQLGCSDRMVAVDVSTAKSRHFSQEFRLSSSFEGAFNFSLGANFLRYDTEDKYYVFINSLGLVAAADGPATPYIAGVSDNRECLLHGPLAPNPGVVQSVSGCEYMDPNPIGNLNDEGHNYFLSRNPYKLISYAIFGEAYYNITDQLKLTAGLRWTVDRKKAPRIPSWILAADTIGYPVMEVVSQEWREPTGRLTIDWKPELNYTDQTLVYASYAHGYKAGGANPPPAGIVMYCAACGNNALVAKSLLQQSATHPKTFDPEFVNAFELGTKNTLLDGRLTLNGDAFYYDYTGYQISQIVDRSAVNMNFDARVWGLELEADWRPVENLRLGFKGGYENTRVANGMQAVDLMDRTAGHPGWIVVKPFPTFSSNCILPAWLFVGANYFTGQTVLTNLGGAAGGNPSGCELAYVMDVDPGAHSVNHDAGIPINYALYSTNPSDFPGWPTGAPTGNVPYPGWDPSTAPNHGEGFYKNLAGNQLPNAPHFTATITADYTLPLPNDWLMTLHTDLYYQSEAWARIFNMPGYDKLKAYNNINLAAIFTNEDAGWKVMAYVKNVFDKSNITGAFLNSDDTGLTTNVFINEPRLYGLRVTKEWTGEGWWTGANPNHPSGGPYPITVELGGMVQRQSAPYAALTPAFADSFPGVLDPAKAQNRNLDWGDGREVRIVYRPGSAPWSISADYRIGKTNSTDKSRTFVLGAKGCVTSQGVCAAAGNPKYYFRGYNYSDVTVRNKEEHRIVDFDVGRDIGLGAGLRSDVRAGLRYANLNSTEHLQMWGIPDWYIPSQFAFFKYSHNTHYKADLSASREFTGAGPMLSWDAAKQLWSANQGHLDVDWSLAGGVLFGKQKVMAKGRQTSAYFNGKYYAENLHQVGSTQTIGTIPQPRSESVNVPVLDLSLGLSYEIQRVKVGAGYRWERYYDVLDAGYSEHKSYDRTIDGPYFKVSVGFGG